MTDLGTLGFPAAAGEDYVLRLVADLRRAQRELGPSIAKSFAGTVTTLQQTVDAVDEAQQALDGAQQALDAVVTKLSGLRTYASTPGSFQVVVPPGGNNRITSEPIVLSGVVVPPNCALIVTLNADVYISPDGGVANERARSDLSFEIPGYSGATLWQAINTAMVSTSARESIGLSTTRTLRLQPPPGTYELKAWGQGGNSPGAPQTTHQWLAVTLVAQVIPASGF